MAEQRSTSRKAVGLLVKLAYRGVDEFAHRYATNLSTGGMFIRTREPKPVGTELRFRVEVADGQRVLQGLGIVRWTRAPGGKGAPGMGIEFLSLDHASRALVDSMLKSRRAAPAPVAPLSPVEPLHVVPAYPPRGEFGSSPQPFEATVAPIAHVGVPPSAWVPPPDVPPGGEPALGELAPIASASASAASATPWVSDPSTEIDVDLADLVAGTPEPPRGGPVPSGPGLPGPSSVPGEPAWLHEAAGPVSPSAIKRVVQPLAPAARTPLGAASSSVVVAPAAGDLRVPQAPVFLKPTAQRCEGGPVIAIDLGTASCACAALTGGRPVLLSSKEGSSSVASVVAVTQRGKLLVGGRAKAQMGLNPTRTVLGAKRLLGLSAESAGAQHLRSRAHVEFLSDALGRTAARLGPHVVSLEEVQGLLLRECREVAEAALGQPIARAVVTCPAHYGEAQRQALRRAGAMAGLKVERLLSEPTAAALSLGLNRDSSKCILVYSLGAGSFEATVLKVEQNVHEVLATRGDAFLGGVEFDAQVTDLLLERFARQHGRAFEGDRGAICRVAEVAEKAKVTLSERTSIDVHLPMLEVDSHGRPMDLDATVSRAELEAACAPLVERTMELVRAALLDAKLEPRAVDDIVLVGAMSRMPLVRERLGTLLDRVVSPPANAGDAVALGAALYTACVDKVSSVVLMDVVPATLGLGQPGGAYHRLIDRNTPLPAMTSFSVSTTEDDQQTLEVLLFEGEEADVAANALVGVVRLDELPPGPRGSVQVNVALYLDAECLLDVQARDAATRRPLRATLDDSLRVADVPHRLQMGAGALAKSTAAVKRRMAELARRAGNFWRQLETRSRDSNAA